jgi:hypothetical protein
MRRNLLADGFAPALAWAVETRADGPLYYLTPDGDQHAWWFHVAVALPVVTENGAVEMCVFDPSIYDGPVRLQVWAEEIGAAARHAGIRDFDDESENGLSAEACAVVRKMRLLDHETVIERTNEIFRLQAEKCSRTRIVCESHVRLQAERELGHAWPRQGDSWMAAALYETQGRPAPAYAAPAVPLRFADLKDRKP